MNFQLHFGKGKLDKGLKEASPILQEKPFGN